jgi:hypothetical protein
LGNLFPQNTAKGEEREAGEWMRQRTNCRSFCLPIILYFIIL